MARRIAVEIVGDSSSLERAFARSSKSATRFEKDISKMSRGAAAGSGLFHGLGRSLAFASGGFLAFESVTSFLRESVDAAREAAVAQRSLAAQMKASGESFKAHREQIEKVSLSYGKFGFQNDAVVESLTVLERGTGKINTAIRLQGLTADLARAKNLDLAKAATVVAKVFGGQETALRRAVPGLHKAAHGWDLIKEAQQKLAGQAAANTTSAERFQATLHDTEEIIGTALLPTLNRYLDSLSKWMANTENQAKIQKAANETAKTGVGVFGALAKAVGAAADAYGKYQELASKLPGGKGGALRKFFGGTLFDQIRDAAKRARQIQDYFSGVKAPAARILPPPFGDFLPGAPSRRPATPAPARAKPRSLQGRFNLAELKLAQARITASLADDRRILVVEQAITEQQIGQAKTLKIRTALTQQLAGIVGQIRSIDQDAAAAVKEQAKARKDAAKAARDAAKERLATRLQTGLDRLDFGLEKAQATRKVGDDIKAEKKIIAALKEQARLTGSTVDIARQIFEHRQAVADLLKQKDGDKTGLDWLEFGLEKAQATKKVGDDIKAEKKIIAALKEQARLTGLTVDTARQIFEHRQALADLLKQKGGDKRDPANSLGVAGAVISFRKSAAGYRSPMSWPLPPALQPLPSRPAGVVVNGGLHLHGVQNVAQLEQELQKRAKQRQQPRRGAN